MKKIKEIYQTFLIVSYGFNFFGGGFFYSGLITRSEDGAVVIAMIDMALALFLYLKMDTDRECVFGAVERPTFSIIILLMYLLPWIWRIAC